MLESSHGTQISIYVHGVHDLSNEFQRGPNSIVLAPRWVLFRIAEAPYQNRSTSKKVVVFSGGACLCMGGLSKKRKCILSATSVQMTSNHILVNHRCCTFGKVTQYERPLKKFTPALGTGNNDKEGGLAWSTFNRFACHFLTRTNASQFTLPSQELVAWCFLRTLTLLQSPTEL